MPDDPGKVEVNRIFRCKPDYGDVQLALEILNLHAPATGPNPGLPSKRNFVKAVNKQLASICPRNFVDRPKARSAIIRATAAVRKVISSLQVVGNYQNHCWVPTVLIGVRDPLDREEGSPSWHNVKKTCRPLDYAAYKLYKIGLSKYRVPEGRRFPGPTRAEIQEGRGDVFQQWWAHLGHDEPDPTQPPMGFPLRYQVHPAGDIIDAVTSAGDGNCHWYAIAQALYGDWRRFAEIKADIREYFMHVLSSPGHARYRTYVVLQQSSVEKCQPSHGFNNSWGTLSLARCLHVNHLVASWPMHRPTVNLGLNQIIADFYDIELIEFDCRLEANQSEEHIWYPRARGSRHAGTSQHFLFQTSNTRINHVEGGFSAHDLPWSFDFQGLDADNRDRVDAMPWYPSEGPISATDPFTGIPSQLTPADGIWCADGSNSAPKEAINYVVGGRDHPAFMPVLPDAETISSWNSKVPLPGEDPDPQLGMSTVRVAEGPAPLGRHFDIDERDEEEWLRWNRGKKRRMIG